MDEIMAEYRYDATLRRGRKHSEAQEEEPFSQDTMAIKNLVEEMRAFTKNNPQPSHGPLEPPPPAEASADEAPAGGMPADGSLGDEPTADLPPPPEPFAIHVDFDADGDFGSAFAPSDDFVLPSGEEDLPEEETRPPREPLWVRMRRRARKQPPEEAAAAPLPVDVAAHKLTGYVRFFTARAALASFLTAFLIFLTFSHRLGLSLPAMLTFARRPSAYLAVSLLLQILVMACAIDVLARGLLDLCHFRPGMESAALVSCAANILYIAAALLKPSAPAYLPYCAVASVSAVCCLWAGRLRFSAYRHTYRTAAQASDPYVIVREENVYEGSGAFLKRRGDISDFVGRTEQPDGAARFSMFFVPLGILVSLLFAAMANVRTPSVPFFCAFAAIVSMVAPFCGMFAYVLPFRQAAGRLALSGSALAGWAAAQAFYAPAAIIVEDSEIFPPGSVTLTGLKVFGSNSFDKVISYAASLTAASGSGLAYPFVELLRGQSEALRHIQEFQHYEGGGVGGEIGGDRILLGTASFMLRMGIRLPRGFKLPNAIFIAVNLDLVGIFAINYQPIGVVRRGLIMCLRHKFTPVLALRDVNLTPSFVSKQLKMKLDGAEFPTIEQRLLLSDPSLDVRARPVAVVGRDGFAPFAESLIAGRRVGQVTRINLALTLLCTLIGLLVMCYLVLRGEMAAASPCNVLVFLGLWTLPTLLVSGLAARY
ncbi:MAG: hypothetical protein LBC26_05705 [Oscillospiraceae bacterium]|nr:hypothetical protein [Oscillospiraceae bacterium]